MRRMWRLPSETGGCSSHLRSHHRPRDAKLLHAGVKCRPLDSQTGSGPLWTADNPPPLLKNLAYVISLRFLQGNCLRGFVFGGRLQVPERWAANVSRGEKYTPLDEVLQFSNVSRPLVSQQSFHHLGGNFVDVLARLLRIYPHEVHHQQRDVL